MIGKERTGITMSELALLGGTPVRSAPFRSSVVIDGGEWSRAAPRDARII